MCDDMKGKTNRAKRLLMMGDRWMIPKDERDEEILLRRTGNDPLRLGGAIRAFYTLDENERAYVLMKVRGRAWACPVAPVSNTGVKMVQAGLFGSGGVEYTNGKNEGGQA